LRGAPVNTFDADIVYEVSDENTKQLICALRKLNAYHRGRGDQRIGPRATDFRRGGDFLLLTDAGPLDVLSTIGAGHTYANLLEHSSDVDLGMTLRVLDLAMLIQSKEEANRPKDRSVLLPGLRETLKQTPAAPPQAEPDPAKRESGAKRQFPPHLRHPKISAFHAVITAPSSAPQNLCFSRSNYCSFFGTPKSLLFTQ